MKYFSIKSRDLLFSGAAGTPGLGQHHHYLSTAAILFLFLRKKPHLTP